MNPGGLDRVLAVTGLVVRLAWRQRFPGILLAVGGGLAFLAIASRDLGFGVGEVAFLRDSGLGVLAFASAVLAVVSGGTLLAGDPARVEGLFATPLREAELVVGHLLATLLLQVALVLPLVVGIGVLLEARAGELAVILDPGTGAPEALADASRGLGAAAFGVLARALILAAASLAFAAWSRRWTTTVLAGTALAVAGLLRPLAAQAWQVGEGIVATVAWAVVRLVPDLARHDLAGAVPEPRVLVVIAGTSLAWAAAFAVAAVVGLRLGKEAR